VLVATHFHDVFREGILDPKDMPINFCHMQVMFTTSSGAIVGVDDSSEPPVLDSGCDITNLKATAQDNITHLYRLVASSIIP
jgi:DNA mismatch repair protein MSH5